MKVTAPQLKALISISANKHAHGRFNYGTYKINTLVLKSLHSKGLIESDAPYAYRFHTVRITDAGRAYLDSLEVAA